jgi:hypothetical protein
VSPPLLRGSAGIDAESRSDLPGNRTAGSMLLTVLALSDNNLLAALREPQALQRVELSLHYCLSLALQDEAWLPAWHAVNDLQRVLVSLVPAEPSMVEPYSDANMLRIWHDLGSHVCILRTKLRWVEAHFVELGRLTKDVQDIVFDVGSYSFPGREHHRGGT